MLSHRLLFWCGRTYCLARRPGKRETAGKAKIAPFLIDIPPAVLEHLYERLARRNVACH